MIEEGGEGLWSFCCLDIIGNEKDCFFLVKSNLKAKNQKLHGMAKKREKVFATAFFKGREREREGQRAVFEGHARFLSSCFCMKLTVEQYYEYFWNESLRCYWLGFGNGCCMKQSFLALSLLL